MPRLTLTTLVAATMISGPAAASADFTGLRPSVGAAMAVASGAALALTEARPFQRIDRLITERAFAPETRTPRRPVFVDYSGCINRYPRPAIRPYYDDGFNHCAFRTY